MIVTATVLTDPHEWQTDRRTGDYSMLCIYAMAC